MSIDVDPESIFDIQIKRIHEYKRQLMLTFYAIGQYNRLKADPNADVVPRTILVGGKAAAGSPEDQLFIELMNEVAEKITDDPAVNKRVKFIFHEIYRVTDAEITITVPD